MKKNTQFLLLSMLLSTSFMTGLRAQDTYLKRVTFGAASSLQEARRIIKTPDNKYLVAGYVANNDTSLDLLRWGTKRQKRPFFRLTRLFLCGIAGLFHIKKTQSGGKRAFLRRFRLPTATSLLNRDGLVFKMEENGNILWAKKYGGINWEEFYDVVQSGSYYYCIGYTRTWTYGSFLGSPPGPGLNNLIADIFVVKIKLDGTVVWAKNMGRPTNGNSAGDGNEYGLRGIACAQGGVIVVARMNIGFGSNQNSGLIWVDSDGKARWAYQYDFPNNASANELTQGIWKDGAQTYVTGGWFNKFNGITGGFLYKVDQNGAIIWQKFTEVANAQFESQYNRLVAVKIKQTSNFRAKSENGGFFISQE